MGTSKLVAESRATSRLWFVGLLLALNSVSCAKAQGEYQIAKIDLGQQRSIVILASETMEVSQAIYYQVMVDGKIIVPIFRICSGHDSGKLNFRTITAKNGDLVGVFEQRYPNDILALHDFNSNRTWPEARDKSLAEAEQLRSDLLRELQAEHQNLTLQTETGRGCY